MYELLIIAPSTGIRTIRAKEAALEFKRQIHTTILHVTRIALLSDEDGMHLFCEGKDIDLHKFDAIWTLSMYADIDIPLNEFADNNGIFFVKDAYLSTICADKTASTINALCQLPTLKVPKQVNVYDYAMVHYAVDTVGLPCIVKPDIGSEGKGVVYCKTFDDVYYAVVDRLTQIVKRNGTYKANCIIQEYIDNDFVDERLIPLEGKKIINAELRHGVKDDPNHRNNISAGGYGEKFVPTQEEKDIVLSIMRGPFKGMTYSGLDLIRRTNGDLYFLEINSEPGLKIVGVTGKNHYKDVMQHIIEKISENNNETVSVS